MCLRGSWRQRLLPHFRSIEMNTWICMLWKAKDQVLVGIANQRVCFCIKTFVLPKVLTFNFRQRFSCLSEWNTTSSNSLHTYHSGYFHYYNASRCAIHFFAALVSKAWFYWMSMTPWPLALIGCRRYPSFQWVSRQCPWVLVSQLCMELFQNWFLSGKVDIPAV